MRNCLKIIVLTALCGALCITALSCRDGETKERDGQAAVSSTVTAALETSAPVSTQIAATETTAVSETAAVPPETNSATEMAPYYFIWKNGGNAAFYEDAVPYSNGMDITLTAEPAIFSISRNTGWEIGLETVLPKDQIGEWSHLVGLERLTNGQWERQAILWDQSLYRFSDAIAYSYSLFGEVGYPIGDAAFAEAFGYRKLGVLARDIYPDLTPGQYRFLFYVTVNQEGKGEHRVYYVPFEVIE